MKQQVEFRLPLWSAIAIAVTIVGTLAYMTAALQAARRHNALLEENIQLRQDLRKKTDELHRIEIGLVNVYRVAVYDLMRRTGLDGMSRPGEHGATGSVFLTIFKAVDDVTEDAGVGGGDDEDEPLPEMRERANAEDSVEAPK